MGMTRFLRRNWLWVGFAVLLSGLAINIAANDGLIPLAVIAGVAVGAYLVCGVIVLLSGRRVAKHAAVYRRELPAIEQQQRLLETTARKELRK